MKGALRMTIDETNPVSSAAEQKIMRKYKKVYGSVLDLLKAIQSVEPGGVLTDDIVINEKSNGQLQLGYVATPVQLTVSIKERTFILKMIENPGKGRGVTIS
jgi:hypothetical protein